MKFRSRILQGYDDYPAEIQNKMRNLFSLGIIAILFFGFMFVRAVWFEYDLYIILASILAFTVIGVSISFIGKKKPVAAGNTAICMMFYIFIINVLRDLFEINYRQISRINDTGIEIVFGLMVTTLFAILRRQYLFAILAGFFILISHFLIITFRDFGGEFTLGNCLALLESAILVTASYLISLSVLSLTTQRRGDVLSNVLFFKWAKGGPVVVHAEHTLQPNEEADAGGYFYTLIGQGNKYPVGLFGPIPFGMKESNNVALVYASNIKDKEVPDPRLKDQNYVLVALITTPDKIPLIDRPRLEKLLYQLTREISDLSLLSGEQYNKMIVRIRAV